MTSRAEIWDEACRWIGTPVIHQASQRGLGCDCKGLVAGVARALGRPEGSSRWALQADYHGVDPDLLRAGLTDLFDPAPTIQLGDVLLLRMKGKAQHLAIAGDGWIIHAYASARVVARTRLAVATRAWPLDSVWAWRGI